MENTIWQTLGSLDFFKPLVQEGKYDLIGHDGEIILPQVWETYIKPGMSVTMHMRPEPEPDTLSPPEYSSGSIEYDPAPLSLARNSRYEDMLEQYAEASSKDDDRETLLHVAAAKSGHDAVVKLLLDKGASLNTTDENNQTALHWAAKNGHDAVVKLLLDKGVNLYAKDTNNQTPLSLAAAGGHEAVVKLLLEKGARSDEKNSSS